MAGDLENTIRENAEGPAEAHDDSGGMRQHGLRDQIEVDRYLNSKKAARSKRRGIQINKLVPPGAA